MTGADGPRIGYVHPRPVARLGALLLSAAMTLPAAVGARTPAHAHDAEPVCPDVWHVVELPGVTEEGQLHAVDTAGPSSAWAVGESYDEEGRFRSLALRWDGRRWAQHPVPNDPTHIDWLSDVAAIDVDDAWAVGTDIFAALPDRTLIVRWNGDGWDRVTSPNAGPAPDDNGSLRGVTALAPDDAWAVGSFRDPAPRTLALHWDGRDWRVVETPMPDDAEAAWLDAVSGIDSDDVWAVGGYLRLADSTRHPLALHWDGTAWTQHDVPPPTDEESELRDVGVLASDDAWAVGHDGTAALRLHWDGTAWQRTDVVAGIASYSGLAATGPADVWAVGARLELPDEVLRTLTERYDGRDWVDVPGPSILPIEERLEDVAVSRAEQWAVGSYFRPDTPDAEEGILRPLVARRCGC